MLGCKNTSEKSHRSSEISAEYTGIITNIPPAVKPARNLDIYSKVASFATINNIQLACEKEMFVYLILIYAYPVTLAEGKSIHIT